MAIDASIIGGLRPIQIQQQDPLTQYGKALQLKALMNQGEQSDIALADDRATRQAFQQSGGDLSKARELLMQGGQYKQVQSIDKTLLENKEKQSTIDKNQQSIVTGAIAQHRDALANVNDPASAAQWVAAGHNDPVIGPVLSKFGNLKNDLAEIPKDPIAFQQWKQMNALGATKFIEMNKPTYHNIDSGQQQSVLSMPGLGGAPQVVASVQKRATPDAILRDNREAKPPPGYRYKEDGSMEAIPGGPADLKQAGMYNADVAQMTNAKSGLDRLAVTANELLHHPGLAGITGVRGAIPNIPGTDAANAQALLNTLKSQVGFGVLQDMRNASKTGGALGNVSDAEGKRLEANLAALEKAQSLDQFKDQLNRILSYTESAKGNLDSAFNLKHSNRAAVKQEQTNAAKPAKTEFNSLPDPAQFNGKRIQGPNGIMRSNGKSWVMEK